MQACSEQRAFAARLHPSQRRTSQATHIAAHASSDRTLLSGDLEPSVAAPMARQRLQQVFHGRTPALLLERSIGARAGVDADLWGALPFAGQVTPDLPVASSWAGLLQAALRRWAAEGRHVQCNAVAIVLCIAMFYIVTHRNDWRHQGHSSRADSRASVELQPSASMLLVRPSRQMRMRQRLRRPGMTAPGQSGQSQRRCWKCMVRYRQS